jgi:hypothetical protein
MEVTYNTSKVDLALAALSKLPAEERKTILAGLKEIVSGYARKSDNVLKTDGDLAFAWWIWE